MTSSIIARRGWLAAGLVAAIGLTTGCAGARSGLRLDDARHPVSMSGYLEGPDGRALSPRDLEVLGSFEHSERRWGLLYSFLPLGGDVDLSEAITQQIEAAGGEGMINMTVESEGCTLNYLPAVSLLPVWPGCADLRVSGEIVRRKGSQVSRSTRRR